MNSQKSTSPLPERSYDREDQVVIVDGRNCQHKFVMKGFRACECLKCGFGTFVNNIEDFKKFTAKFGIIEK